jgi:hypothetical protein
VERLRAENGTEDVETLALDSFELLEVHEGRTLAPERDIAAPSPRSPGCSPSHCGYGMQPVEICS